MPKPEVPTLRHALTLLFRLGKDDLSDGMRREYRNHAELYLLDWIDRPLASLTRSMLRQRRDDITAQRPMPRPCRKKAHRPKGPTSAYAAAWMLRTLKRAYNLAADEWHDIPLPRNRRKRSCPIRRARRTRREDYARLWGTIMSRPNPIRRAYYQVRLFTGLRGTSLKALRWDDIDFDQMALHVRHTKVGLKYTIPMTTAIASFLEAVPRTESPLVFIASSRTGAIAEERDDDLAVTPGQFRHLYATAGIYGGVTKERREILMHHRRAGVTQDGYTHPDWRFLADDQNAISGWLDSTCRGEP